MGSISFFAPKSASTTLITAGLASTNIALPSVAAAKLVMRIKNLDATNTAFIEIGNTSAVAAIVPTSATLGSMPVGPGETLAISVPDVSLWAAAICTAGTPAVAFTPGNGDAR